MVGWRKIREAAAYAGVSPRTFADWLKQGLVHSKLPSGTVLIRLADIDKFLKQFQVVADKNQLVDQIVDDVLRDF